MTDRPTDATDRVALNESPSEKEGKLFHHLLPSRVWFPSMKVPPKRKGNPAGRV